MRKTLFTVVAVLLPAWVAAQAGAPLPSSPSAPPRFEVWAGGIRTPATSDGTLQSDYAPPLVFGTGTGSLSQTLTVESSGSWGFEFGARVYLTSHIGLEASGSRSSATLSGANAPYDLALDYIARQPPSYEPKPYQFARTLEWADTEGDLTSTTFRVGPVIGWSQRGGPLSGTVSGGLALRRHTGVVTSLAYTAFHMGGHSTLFYSEHRVDVEPDPDTWCRSSYLSADLRVRVAARVRLSGGVRVHVGSRLQTVPVRVVGLVDPNDDVFVPEVSTVTAALEPGATMNIPVTRWQAFAGIVFVLK